MTNVPYKFVAYTSGTIVAATFSVYLPVHSEVDSFLADLWKAYKKCIRNNRTGPASQLLKEIEEHLGVN